MSRRGRLHRLELWMDDATSDHGPWPWLLQRLGYTWPTGRSWDNGDAYIVLESGITTSEAATTGYAAA